MSYHMPETMRYQSVKWVDGKLAIGFETMVGVTVNWRTIDVTH